MKNFSQKIFNSDFNEIQEILMAKGFYIKNGVMLKHQLLITCVPSRLVGTSTNNIDHQFHTKSKKKKYLKGI